MSFTWLPLPHFVLEGDNGSELFLNVVVYLFGVALIGSVLWLAGLAWADRER
jgi:hypothetical protein